jgi:signal peptidase I
MEVGSFEDFKKLKKLKSFTGNIVSDSMEPLIRVGDKISVQVGDKNLHRFDIIVFWGNNQLMCHYLWSINRYIEPCLIQTRSLRNKVKDNPVPIEAYLGKVVSHRISTWYKIKLLFSH